MKKVYKIIAQFSFGFVVSVISFFVALYILAAFIHEVFLEKEDELDVKIFNFLSAHAPDSLYQIMRIFTFFGKPDFMIPAYCLLTAWFIFKRNRKYAIETAITAITSTSLLFGLKQIFKRNRPHLPIFEHLPGYSFPSGHALLSFVFCSLLIYFAWNSNLRKSWKWITTILLLAFSFLVGISRIVLRVHYATDVIAGFCLGYIWVLLFLWIQKKLARKTQHVN